MRKNFILLIIFLFFLFPSLVKAQVPELEILHPKEGQIIKHDFIVVSLQVSNFDLTDYHLNPPPKENEGHFHICLNQDTNDVTEKNCREHIFLDDEVFTDLSPGEHFLTVELVGNDHSSFEHPIKKQVTFTITAKEPLSPIITSPPPTTQTPIRTPLSLYQLFLAVIIGVAILVITFIFLAQKRKSSKE